jgi:pyruvate,water dikinase
LAAQRRRNELAPAWRELCPSVTPAAPPDPARSMGVSRWNGLPVCPGVVEGPVLVVRAGTPRPAFGFILVFAQARPETVEWFEGALGVAYGQGGILSHACSVARERGLPCATAFGMGLSLPEGARVRLDGGAGTLEIVADRG